MSPAPKVREVLGLLLGGAAAGQGGGRDGRRQPGAPLVQQQHPVVGQRRLHPGLPRIQRARPLVPRPACGSGAPSKVRPSFTGSFYTYIHTYSHTHTRADLFEMSHTSAHAHSRWVTCRLFTCAHRMKLQCSYAHRLQQQCWSGLRNTSPSLHLLVYPLSEWSKRCGLMSRRLRTRAGSGTQAAAVMHGGHNHRLLPTLVRNTRRLLGGIHGSGLVSAAMRGHACVATREPDQLAVWHGADLAGTAGRGGCAPPPWTAAPPPARTPARRARRRRAQIQTDRPWIAVRSPHPGVPPLPNEHGQIDIPLMHARLESGNAEQPAVEAWPSTLRPQTASRSLVQADHILVRQWGCGPTVGSTSMVSAPSPIGALYTSGTLT